MEVNRQELEDDILALGKTPTAPIEPILKKILAFNPPLLGSEVSPLLKRIAAAKGCKKEDVVAEFEGLKPKNTDGYAAVVDPGVAEDAAYATALEQSDFLIACVAARQVESARRPKKEGEYSLAEMEAAIAADRPDQLEVFKRDNALSETVLEFIAHATRACEANGLAVHVHADGSLYKVRTAEIKGETHVLYSRTCTPILPKAAADSPEGGGWVRVFLIRTLRGTLEEVVVSQGEFVKGGAWLKKMQEAGAVISDAEMTLLALQYTGAPKIVHTCNGCGWQDDETYVSPNGDILTPKGKTTDHVVNFQPLPGYDPIGDSLAAANEAIFRYCEANPILVLTTCAALSAPFLRDMNQSGGGIHVHGDPGTGKTIATRVGTATTGSGAKVTDGGAVHSWRSTDNSIELEAKSVNDSVFPRDELHLCRPKTVDQVAYMLGDGEGKKTMTRNRERRDTHKFRNMVISSGELSTKDHIESDRSLSYRAGTQARLCDIPVKPKADGGVFDTLHGFADAMALAEHLDVALTKHSGWHARALVQIYLDNRDKLLGVLKTNVETNYSRLVNAHGLSSEDDASRATKRFALIAAVGEIAIGLKLLPWAKGSAFSGVKACYKRWLGGQGGGNILALHGLQSLETWLTKSKAAFEWTKDKDNPNEKEIEQRVSQQVGYKRTGYDVIHGIDYKFTEFILDRKTFEVAVGRSERAERVLAHLKDRQHEIIDLTFTHGYQHDTPRGTLPGKRCYILRVYEVSRLKRERHPSETQPPVREPEYEM